jgi:tetratricopeptide (TPR) repeat protein
LSLNAYAVLAGFVARYRTAVAVCVVLAAPVLLAALSPESSQAKLHLERGKDFLARGDLNAAEAELRQAVFQAKRCGECLSLLGIVLGMKQQLEESERFLEKALQVDSGDYATRRNLAWNQFQLGELAPARANLERILKQRPGDPEATLLLGMVEEEGGQYAAALRLLTSVPEQVRKRPESVAALARAYYRSGDRERARQALKSIPATPAGQEGIFLGGRVAAEMGDLESAESLFGSIWPAYPDTRKLGYALALVEYRRGRFSESVTTLRQVMAAGNESAELYNLLGWCLYRQDDVKGAVAALDHAIALDPSDESNYLDVGMMLLERHLEKGALVAADNALKVAPDSYRAHRLKALIEFKLGKVTDAENLYARAVELNPADAEAITGLATAQLDKGDARKAEQTLKQGIERLPRAAILYQAYANLLLWGDHSNDAQVQGRAVELFRKAAALDPSLAEPHYQLGKIALREDRARDAVQELETAVKLDPQSSKNHYALAQAYRKQGRTAEAAREANSFQTLKTREEQKYPAGRANGANAPGAAQPDPSR